MNRKFWLDMLMACVMSLAMLGLGSAAWAATPAATYDLTWFTIDGGGGTSTAGAYSLGGTIGQADAGLLSGGAYTLRGGFWAGATIDYRTYLPLVERQ